MMTCAIYPLTVNYRKINSDVPNPVHATSGSAGIDLHVYRILDRTETTVTYGTGICVEIPEGFAGLIFPRSSICKTHLMMTNSVGVIDSDYRGEIRAVFQQTRMTGGEYKIGDRFCQLVLVPIPEVTLNEVPSLSETSRGVGGYGSTGN